MALGATDRRRHCRPSSADSRTYAPAVTDHQMARSRDARWCARRRCGPWRTDRSRTRRRCGPQTTGCRLPLDRRPDEQGGRQRGQTPSRIRRFGVATSADRTRHPFRSADATRCCAMDGRSCHHVPRRSSCHGGAATMTRDDPIEARPGTLGPATRKNDESPRLAGALFEESGGVLLSQGVYPQVPSALAGLTAVFGMGTGVTPPLWPPEISCQRGSPTRTPEQARAFFKPSPRPISTGRLNALPHVHLRPINVMVSSRALPG